MEILRTCRDEIPVHAVPMSRETGIADDPEVIRPGAPQTVEIDVCDVERYDDLAIPMHEHPVRTRYPHVVLTRRVDGARVVALRQRILPAPPRGVAGVPVGDRCRDARVERRASVDSTLSA